MRNFKLFLMFFGSLYAAINAVGIHTKNGIPYFFLIWLLFASAISFFLFSKIDLFKGARKPHEYKKLYDDDSDRA